MAEEFKNNLERMWYDNMSLHRRFDLMDNPLDSRREKVSEEFVEFLKASVIHELSIEGIYSDFELKKEVLKEGLDLIYTIFGVMQRHGIQWNDVNKEAAMICQKNMNKDHNTHVVVNGMIVNRKKVMEIKTNE